MALNRRSLGILAVGAAVVVGTPPLLRWSAPLPDTRPLRGLPGFYMMRTGALTAASPAPDRVEWPHGPVRGPDHRDPRQPRRRPV